MCQWSVSFSLLHGPNPFKVDTAEREKKRPSCLKHCNSRISRRTFPRWSSDSALHLQCHRRLSVLTNARVDFRISTDIHCWLGTFRLPLAKFYNWKRHVHNNHQEMHVGDQEPMLVKTTEASEEEEQEQVDLVYCSWPFRNQICTHPEYRTQNK